jgi:hypothetical protein
MTLVEDPIEVLDRMRSIVEHEMIQHDVYISQSVVDRELAAQGAVCGGHRVCAIGALYLAAGVGIKQNENGGRWLPGVSPHDRHDFMFNKPTLRLVYDTLNEVALDAANERGILIAWIGNEHGGLESLFEWGDHVRGRLRVSRMERELLLEVIDEAKRTLS